MSTDGQQHPRERTLQETPRHQKAQIAEDQSAGSDVHASAPADQPHSQAARQHHERGHRAEEPRPAKQYQRAQQQKRDGVRHEMREAAVNEGREQDAGQPGHCARADAVLPEVHKRQHAQTLHHPHHAERDQQLRGVMAQGERQGARAGGGQRATGKLEFVAHFRQDHAPLGALASTRQRR